MLENIISSLRVFAPSSFTLVRYVRQVHTSCLGCYLQTSLVTHVKTMCPHTVPQSYFLLTMSLMDVVVRKLSLNHIILKQHRNISKGTAWQIMPWLSVVQLNETCFLGETSTCRWVRGEIECMKVEIFKKILFQLVF